MSLLSSRIETLQGTIDNIKSYMALQDEIQWIIENIVAKQGKQIAKLVNDSKMHLTSSYGCLKMLILQRFNQWAPGI